MSLFEGSRDELIIALHDEMMKERDPSKKLFLKMLKISGMPLIDMLKDEIAESGNAAEALSSFLNAMTNYTSTIASGLASVYFPADAHPEFVDMFTNGVRQGLTHRLNKPEPFLGESGEADACSKH